MRAGELRECLALLPDDMLVLLDGTYHVTAIRKQGARTIQGVPLANPPIPDIRQGPAIIIEGVHRYFGVPWNKPEPAWSLKGRWPRPRMTKAEEATLLALASGNAEGPADSRDGNR